MQDRTRDVVLIAASVGGLLLAALLTRHLPQLRLEQVSLAAVAKLLARALFLVLLGAIAYRSWDVRQNRVLLGGRKPVPVAQPERRRRSSVHASSAEHCSQAAVQPAAPAAAATTEAAALDTKTGEPDLRAVPHERASSAQARYEHVPGNNIKHGAESHHATGASQQPRTPGPPDQSTSSGVSLQQPSAAEPPAADASVDSHANGIAPAASKPHGHAAASRGAVAGSESGSAAPFTAAEGSISAANQQQALQEPSNTAAAPAQQSNDGMAPKTLQQARAEMLERQEAAKADHARRQREEREQQRRQRLDEAEARLEAWRAAQRAAEAAEEMSWLQLTAERRAAEVRRQLLQQQDAEFQQALQHDAEAEERRRRELDAQQEAANARRVAAERAWLECARVAADAAARLSRCPEPEPNAGAAATLSLRLPDHPVQRRRFSSSAANADVYAWAQLALLEGICPTMDADLQRLRQQAPGAFTARSDQPDGSTGSGGADAAADTASGGVGDATVGAPPADAGEGWVQRWAEAGAGSSGGGWIWRGGWRLVQTYPRWPLPHGEETVESAGLMPQTALAVEQLEGHERM